MSAPLLASDHGDPTLALLAFAAAPALLAAGCLRMIRRRQHRAAIPSSAAGFLLSALQLWLYGGTIWHAYRPKHRLSASYFLDWTLAGLLLIGLTGCGACLAVGLWRWRLRRAVGAARARLENCNHHDRPEHDSRAV